MLRAAVRRRAALITADEDFADIVRYPLSTHYGIIMLRLTRRHETDVHDALRQFLNSRPLPILRRRLVIIDQFGFRILRP